MSSANRSKNIKVVVGQTKNSKEFFAVLPEENMSPGARPRSVSDDPIVQQRDWVQWGVDDRKPTKNRLLIEKVSIAGATIAKVTRKLVGNGLCYYNPDEIKNGVVKHAYNKDVEDFLLNNRIKTKWMFAQASNYNYYMNCFGTFILSNDRKKIARIVHRETEHCRVKLNKELTEVKEMVFSPYFSEGGPANVGQRLDFPMMQLDQSSTDLVRNSKALEFGYHTYFPTPGSFYYGIPWWEALFQKDGWLNVSANVPKIILGMHRNQVNIKYVIYIPESYFFSRYEGWKNMKLEAKKKIIDKKILDLNNALTGTENAYNTISHVFKETANDFKEYSKIKIEAIDDKLKKDSWLPDANASDAQIVQAWGEHPSQMGLAQEGGNLSAGGSNQRESYNTSISLNTPDQEILLEPLNFAMRFNGLPYKFFVDHTYHTTTNEQESGLVEGEGSLKIEKPNNATLPDK
jgi:hypothetical protein